VTQILAPDGPVIEPPTMRLEETFTIRRAPEEVFDYIADPTKLSDWQTASRSIEQLSDGPPGPGARFRERMKPPLGREFEQITQFAEYERPRRLRVSVIEGPQPIDGTWTLEAAAVGTRVVFVAEGELRGPMRPLGPLITRAIARQFASYHRNLRRNLESG
jgi:uncharacterized protein YndB with AHSA1/START domain